MATELQRLRALAKRRHDAATSKASRLNKQGVKIGGTEYDPRVKKQNINRYNKRQLEAYVRRLDNFTDRSNQFVAGRAGTPIPKSQYESFQRAQLASNIRAEKYLKPHADRVLPTTNVSVSQRLHDLDAKEFNVLRMGRGTNTAPFQINTQTATDFYDAKAMQAAEKAMRKKIQTNYLPRTLKRYRSNAAVMLETVGESELSKQVANLSDQEFDLLWNLTSFPEGIKLNYENITHGISAKWAQEIAHDNMLEAKELVGWVQTQKY